MVFHVLCEYRVGKDLGIQPHMLTLLEEPEAHLHPQAQSAVGRLVDDLPGQVVVATHSDVLVSAANPAAIRLLRPSDPGAVVHQLSVEGAKKVAVFRRFVERPLGEIFFARLVVFVDGTAERISLPVLLEPLLGKDPAGAGVSFVDLEGMASEQLKKVTAALEELGEIPWLVFLDNDADGWAAIDGVTGQDGTELSAGHDQVVVSGDRQLEQLLLDAGYEDEVREVANEYAPWSSEDPRFGQPRVPAAGDMGAQAACLDFLSHNKSWAGELVAKRVIEEGKLLPEAVVELGEKIRDALSISEPLSDRYRIAAGIALASGGDGDAG